MFPRAIVSAGSVISEIGCVWWLTQPCSHFNSTLPSTNKKLYLPLTFLWLWDPTGGPSCEEVKVRDGVHLHVVKEHFVIRTSVNLKETRTSRFLAKKRIRTRATFRKKKHFERVSVCVPERSGCWLGCRWRYIWPTSGLPDWQSGRSGFSHCSELWHLLKHNVIGQRLNSEITNDSCNVKFNWPSSYCRSHLLERSKTLTCAVSVPTTRYDWHTLRSTGFPSALEKVSSCFTVP